MVPSVSRGFTIMRLLAEAGALSLSEITRAAALSSSSCFNLLATLIEEGAVEREPGSKRYRLSPLWIDVAALKDGEPQRLADRARPAMTRFASKFEAAIGLWTPAKGNRLNLVARAESETAMRIQLIDGQRQPDGSGAVGRAFAAAQGLSEDDLRHRYDVVRWQREVTFSDYAKQVESAAEQGFAVDDGYTHLGVCSVAAAWRRGDYVFVLSASVIAATRTAEQVGALGAALSALSGQPPFAMPS
ncbi:IclR family transcriptional regulator [Sphingomonas sp. GB1N7]|uniref:IclR family transcriptional regulator n=1 Tax=Parasphingomonas caseinilytica TaxID=3096158 RepID=UPI002FC99CEC